MNPPLDSQPNSVGAVAQLGERMTGSHEVRGSIPLGSTNTIKSQGIHRGCPLSFVRLLVCQGRKSMGSEVSSKSSVAQ